MLLQLLQRPLEERAQLGPLRERPTDIGERRQRTQIVRGSFRSHWPPAEALAAVPEPHKRGRRKCMTYS